MKMICFGDSNTYGYDPRSYFDERYDAANRWVDLFAEKSGFNVVNAGENGREIPRHAWEINQFQQMINIQKPVDLLLILLGTNDLLQGNSAESVCKRMKFFLEHIPMEKNEILLIAPPYLKRGTWVDNQNLIDASIRMTECYKALAGRLGIYFVNAANWNIPIAYDGVHFTEEGHREFAKALYSELNKREIL